MARLLMFQNTEYKLKCLNTLESLVGQTKEYSHITLENRSYGLNVTIKLLFSVNVQELFHVKADSIANKYFEILVEVPAEHDSLEGKWRVKEYKKVFLYHYKIPEIENFAVLMTEDGTKAITGILNAFKTINIYPNEMIIELPSGAEALDILRELGEIGWIHISEILDSHVRGAGLYGRKLQQSEIIEDLLSRGGKIKAVVIHHSITGMKIILSSRGTIYSQRNVPHTQFALMIGELISSLKKFGLIRPKKTLSFS